MRSFLLSFIILVDVSNIDISYPPGPHHQDGVFPIPEINKICYDNRGYQPHR